MKLLVFSLLLGAALAEATPLVKLLDPAVDLIIEREVSEDNHAGDPVIEREVSEGASEVFSDSGDKSTRSWQTINGRMFIFQTSLFTWAQAQQRCLALGGNLATIHNKREDDFVKRMAEGRAAWIGLSDSQENGFWFWITSDPLRYTNWCPNEPNNMNGQDCAQTNYSGRKCWDDHHCTEKLPFVCEKKAA